MKKRHFLTAAAVATLATPALAAPDAAPESAPARRRAGGPGLLTITGAIGRGNRGPRTALDQMLVKQQIAFDKAHVFDAPALHRLPAVTIRPTLEYDARPHTLQGPLLTEVLQAAGVKTGVARQLLLRAIDGYTVPLSLAQARQQRFIVATHLDGQPLALGGLGPLWAVFDADRDAAMATKPLPERFAACPWGLYHIEVQAG